MEKPKISVIMPVYNAEAYIEQAIDSVLRQTYSNFELIIINDCSLDNSMDIVRKYTDPRIIIINNEKNSGIAYSRNQGLESSTGKYIAIMDDDDISLPYRFEHEVDFLEENSDIDIVGGRYQTIDADGHVIKTRGMVYHNPRYIKAMHLLQNVYPNSAVMLRKCLIDKYNLRYCDDCLGMEDFRFWIECSKVGYMSNIDELVFQYRISSNSESRRVLDNHIDERKKLYAEFQRYSLYRSGFRLNEDELNILNKVMSEKEGFCDSIVELKKLYKILHKVINQSKQMNCENSVEIEKFCRTILSEKISEMDGWWIEA